MSKKKKLQRKSFRVKANTQLPITAETAPVYVNENTIVSSSLLIYTNLLQTEDRCCILKVLHLMSY